MEARKAAWWHLTLGGMVVTDEWKILNVTSGYSSFLYRQGELIRSS